MKKRGKKTLLSLSIIMFVIVLLMMMLPGLLFAGSNDHETESFIFTIDSLTINREIAGLNISVMFPYIFGRTNVALPLTLSSDRDVSNRHQMIDDDESVFVMYKISAILSGAVSNKGNEQSSFGFTAGCDQNNGEPGYRPPLTIRTEDAAMEGSFMKLDEFEVSIYNSLTLESFTVFSFELQRLVLKDPETWIVVDSVSGLGADTSWPYRFHIAEPGTYRVEEIATGEADGITINENDGFIGITAMTAVVSPSFTLNKDNIFQDIHFLDFIEEETAFEDNGA